MIAERFRLTIEWKDKQFIVLVHPDYTICKNGVPTRFRIDMGVDRNYMLTCTEDGWKSDKQIFDQAFDDAIGEQIVLYYE